MATVAVRSVALSRRGTAAVPRSPARCLVVRAAWGGALPPRAVGATRRHHAGNSTMPHSLRHEERVTAEEELHNSRQVALLAMVPVALMSLKWAVSIGMPALVVPAALLAVPIAGSGLRDLLAEGLCMAWRWTSWIQNHQAPPHAADGSHHHRGGMTRNHSGGRQRSPDRSVPQFAPQPAAQPHHQHHAAPRPQMQPPAAANAHVHAHPAQAHAPSHVLAHPHAHPQHAPHDQHSAHSASWSRHHSSESTVAVTHGHVSHARPADPHHHSEHSPAHHMPTPPMAHAYPGSPPPPLAARHHHAVAVPHSSAATRPSHVAPAPHGVLPAAAHAERESTLGVVAHATPRDTALMDDDMDWPASGEEDVGRRHTANLYAHAVNAEPALSSRSGSPGPPLAAYGSADGLVPPVGRRSA